MTVDFAPASAQQKTALGYVEPSDPLFKQDCSDKTISEELTEILANEGNDVVDDQGDDVEVDQEGDDVDVVDDTAEVVDDTVEDDSSDVITPIVEDPSDVNDEPSGTCDSDSTASTNKCIGLVCSSDTECASGNCLSEICSTEPIVLPDAVAGVGAGLIVLFILLPICCCLGIVWCTCYCFVQAAKSAVEHSANQALQESLLENDAQGNR